LKYLQPLLEEALQKKHTSRSWEKVHGPMTWQHFCRIPFRDNTASSSLNPLNCHEPEPIPALLVSSSDRDLSSWLCVSPYAIKFWDKLNIEPYSKQKNIAYLILCPDVDVIVKNTKNYFKEFNSIYELCHLGVHKSAKRLANDYGVIRIPMNSTTVTNDSTTNDDWFKNISLKTVGVKLKNYFNASKSLSNIIKSLNRIDFTIYDEVKQQHQHQQPMKQSTNSFNQQHVNNDHHHNHNHNNHDIDFNDASPHLDNNANTSNNEIGLTNEYFLLNNHNYQQYQQQQPTTNNSTFNEQLFSQQIPSLQHQQSITSTSSSI